MTDYELYVADPAEPHAPSALTRFRPLLTWLTVLLLASSFTYMVMHNRGVQDPSLQVPAERLLDPGQDLINPPADAAPDTEPATEPEA